MLFNQLQALDPNLPLRIVPLEIRAFSPMEARMKDRHQASLEVQKQAATGSFPLDTSLGDNLPPFLSFRRHKCFELLRCNRLSLYAEFLQ